MDHHDHVGSARQRLGVAGLLVAAIAQVLFVNRDREAETPRYGDGAVGALIVNQDTFVHGVGEFADGGFERRFGVVSRHYPRQCVFPLITVSLLG